MRSKRKLWRGPDGPLSLSGAGAASGAGPGVEALWSSLQERSTSLAPLDRGAAEPCATGACLPFREGSVGALLPAPPGEEGPPRPPEDRALRLCALALEEALDASGWALEESPGAPPPLFLGTALGTVGALEASLLQGASSSGEGGDGPGPHTFEAFAAGVARSLLRRWPPIRDAGTATEPDGRRADADRWLRSEVRPRVFSMTCVSGLCALEAAAMDFALGRARRGLVLAVDALTASMQGGFQALGALSTRGCLRPFDRGHDGILLGEGAACLAVEPLEAALRRGARPGPLILAQTLTSDAWHLTSPDPSGTGMARAIRSALADSGLAAADLGCIVVTAAGSPVYERMLSLALVEALGESAARSIPVTSWEPSIGHALAATGLLAVLHAAEILERRTIPGVYPEPDRDPGCLLRAVVGEALPLQKPAALALTVGFGGQNGATVLAGGGAERPGARGGSR